MSNQRRETKPVRQYGLRAKNRRVIGGLMQDGTILFTFRRLTPDRLIQTQHIRLSGDTVKAMVQIAAVLTTQNPMPHYTPAEYARFRKTLDRIEKAKRKRDRKGRGKK